jgi:hypothetical protein
MKDKSGIKDGVAKRILEIQKGGIKYSEDNQIAYTKLCNKDENGQILVDEFKNLLWDVVEISESDSDNSTSEGQVVDNSISNKKKNAKQRVKKSNPADFTKLFSTITNGQYHDYDHDYVVKPRERKTNKEHTEIILVYVIF